MSISETSPPVLRLGWEARLELAYAVQQNRTVPVHRKHLGPLRVQKHFIDAEGACQHIIVHPPGGMAGGDSLAISVTLGSASDVLITSPGAAKWYDGFGHTSSQSLTLDLAAHARLEWLPQETILYSGADVALSTRICLQQDASLLLGDVVCLGRPACEETFARGYWKQQTEIERDGRLIWCEQTRLPGGSPQLEQQTGLAGHSVVATLLWAGAPLPDALHQAALALETPGLAAASQLPGIWLARFIGDSAEAAHHWLRTLRALLHPFTHGCEAQAPRIWAT
jgi:urease accessory protein